MAGRVPARTYLLTGVSGFIGSTLAAALLAAGHRVLALARNDPRGDRTLDVVKEAFSREPFHASVDWQEQFKVLPLNIKSLRLEHSEDLRSVHEVWHAAAEMSFSPRKLESSFQTNVGLSTQLYELIADLSHDCQRFFYVSTAYTGGTSSDTMHEVLHVRPRLINPYQMTKWSTEMSLAVLAHQGQKLPLTIFRPSLVVGNSKTGHYPGNTFGIYLHLFAMQVASSFGAAFLTVDINPLSRIQVVPIEDLIGNALALSQSYQTMTQPPLIEITHVTGQSVENGVVLEAMKKVLGIHLAIGKPISTLDRVVHNLCGWTNRFGNENIQFDDSRIRARLGKNFIETSLSEKEFETLLGWYSDYLAGEQVKKLRETLDSHLFGKLALNHFPGLGHAIQGNLDRANAWLEKFDRWAPDYMKDQLALRITKMAI